MSSFDRSSHRLAGSGNETGGLIIKKKQDPGRQKSEETFKRPSGSVLGLDILARRKRAEREAAEAEEGGGNYAEKRPRIDRTKDRNLRDNYDDSGVRISFGRSDISKERRYRSAAVETPSHPGGVSDEALEKMQSRLKREQGQGLYASSATGRGRERGSAVVSRGERGGGREREEGRERGSEEGEVSRRMRERAWEQETPRLERGRGHTTPYPRTRGTQEMLLIISYFCYCTREVGRGREELDPHLYSLLYVSKVWCDCVLGNTQ